MKNIRNDYCIRMFTAKGDNMRPHMNNVNLENGYLYATDTSILAKLNVDLCVKKYKEIEKFPNCESVLSTHKSFAVKKVSVDTMFNDLMKIECCFLPKMVECGDCYGEGEVTCECCDNESECKDCKGKGEVSGRELELSSEHDCMLFNKKYKLKYLDVIIRTAVFIGVKEIEISNSEGMGGSLFTVGDFTILLMPVWEDKH